MICNFIILFSGWCRMRERSFATDVICLFVHYLVVKLKLHKNFHKHLHRNLHKNLHKNIHENSHKNVYKDLHRNLHKNVHYSVKICVIYTKCGIFSVEVIKILNHLDVYSPTKV